MDSMLGIDRIIASTDSVYLFLDIPSAFRHNSSTVSLMKVRIGNLEITDITPEELDELVKRYGGAVPTTQDVAPTPPTYNSHEPIGQGAADTVLLRKLVEAGSEGVTTIDIGDILRRRGKAARPALRDWAKRIGLAPDETIDVFEDARVGTQRGLRLKSSILDVARHLMEMGQR